MSASVLACLQRSHMISYHTVCISYFSRFLSFSICLSSASARRFSCQLFGEIRSDNVIICDNRDMTYQYIYISIYLSQIVTTCLIRKPSFPQILHGWFSKILEGSLRTTQLSAQRTGQDPGLCIAGRSKALLPCAGRCEAHSCVFHLAPASYT